VDVWNNCRTGELLLPLDFGKGEVEGNTIGLWFDVGCLFPSSIWKDATMGCFGFAGGICNSLSVFKIGKWVWTENAKSSQ